MRQPLTRALTIGIATVALLTLGAAALTTAASADPTPPSVQAFYGALNPDVQSNNANGIPVFCFVSTIPESLIPSGLKGNPKTQYQIVVAAGGGGGFSPRFTRSADGVAQPIAETNGWAVDNPVISGQPVVFITSLQQVNADGTLTTVAQASATNDVGC